MKDEKNKESSFVEHFTELRSRLIKSFIYLYKYIQLSTFTVCMFSIWSNHEYLFKIYNNDFLVYTGIAISGIAITLFAMSRFSLGKNYSPCYDSYMPKNLKTTGIYSLVRHPIYSSNILLMIGIFISLNVFLFYLI